MEISNKKIKSTENIPHGWFRVESLVKFPLEGSYHARNVKPRITGKYTVEEVITLIKDDLRNNHSLSADVTPIITGGYKTCDCDSWGGPSVSPCSCSPSPIRFGRICIHSKS